MTPKKCKPVKAWTTVVTFGPNEPALLGCWAEPSKKQAMERVGSFKPIRVTLVPPGYKIVPLSPSKKKSPTKKAKR